MSNELVNDAERAEFEAMLKKDFPPWANPMPAFSSTVGYASPRINGMWLGWQAARRPLLPLAQSQQWMPINEATPMTPGLFCKLDLHGQYHEIQWGQIWEGGTVYLFNTRHMVENDFQFFMPRPDPPKE